MQKPTPPLEPPGGWREPSKTYPPLVLNGVDGTTGAYLPSAPRGALGLWLRRQRLIAPPAMPVRVRSRPMPWVVPSDLATSGWGVIFPRDGDARVREKLRPLLDHRRSQASRVFAGYREFTGEQGYHPNDDLDRWLTRHHQGPGPANPEQVPFHLLIVGDPSAIPFEFQQQLATTHSVGRLCFDELAAYARYAEQVVAVEQGRLALPPRLGVFGPRNRGDQATTWSTDYLLEPLLSALRRQRGDGGSGKSRWHVDDFLGERATKARLADLLAGGRRSPALLLTVSHGLRFHPEDPRFARDCGALLCQDWPGPAVWRQGLRRDFFFSAADLAADADLRGRIAVFLACHSAGLPREDSFAHEKNGAPRRLAPEPLLARLPQHLLSKPGGALAAVGHVDRLRGFSYIWPDAGSQIDTILALLQGLMAGEPVGYAACFLADRHAALAARLLACLPATAVRDRVLPSDDPQALEALTDLYTAYVDARGYLVFGDPAVRLVCESAQEAVAGQPF